MKKSAYGILAVSSLMALSLVSCNKEKVDLKEFDYVNDNAIAEVANSGYYANFKTLSVEEKTEILAKLEKYAIEHNLTGLVTNGNGGYSKVSDRVVIPTKVVSEKDEAGKNVYKGEQYDSEIHENVLGYGFGILGDGKLNPDKPLKGIKASEKPDYLQTTDANNPETLNYMDDQGSQVAGWWKYITNSMFGNKLAADGLNYVTYPALATEKNKIGDKYYPLPVDDNGNLVENPDTNQLYSKYRIYVRTDINYNIAEDSKFSSYDNSQVKIEDYETMIKHLHVQKNGLKRAADDLSTSNSIKGMDKFYEATAGDLSAAEIDALWDNVQYKAKSDETGDYVEFEYNYACTPFYAQYYSNSFNLPLPEQFIHDIGGIKHFAANGTAADGSSVTIKDTALSTGPYVVEKWDTKEILFKKADKINQDAFGGMNLNNEPRYQIPGIRIYINSAFNSDKEAFWKEFESGKLDQTGIPKDKISTQKHTKGTQISKGDATFKLNLNTCTQEQWNALFGENGTVLQNPVSDYYQCKPIMSDHDFIKGLTFAIDRKTYSENRGRTPAYTFFSDNYLIDPENHVSYNSTEAHKKVMEELYGENVDIDYAYDLTKAGEYFKSAAENLVASGKYAKGSTAEITITWMYQWQETDDGVEIKKYIEDAWKLAVDPSLLKLKVNNESVTEWVDVYEKHLQVGRFDLGFGSISGNALDPINFLEVLKSDNSSQFTLNWGPDTNKPGIAYNDKVYSFDALYEATDKGAILTHDGELAKLHAATLKENTHNKDGSRNIKLKVGMTNIKDIVKTELDSIELVWADAPQGEDDSIVITDFTVSNGEISFKVSADQASKFKGNVQIIVSYKQSNLAKNNGKDIPEKVIDVVNTLFPTK